jgi:hypothetical protein
MLEKFTDLPVVITSCMEIHTVEEEYIRRVIASVDEAVDKRLVRKGFPPLSKFLRNERFPKIHKVKEGDWDYYFADNNTPNGCFICAVRIKSTFHLGEKCTGNLTIIVKDTYDGSLDVYPDYPVENSNK